MKLLSILTLLAIPALTSLSPSMNTLEAAPPSCARQLDECDRANRALESELMMMDRELKAADRRIYELEAQLADYEEALYSRERGREYDRGRTHPGRGHAYGKYKHKNYKGKSYKKY